MPDSLFTRIIRGELPCYKIWEDADHIAFLDIFPVQEGHTLVVPKRQINYIFDMSEAEYTALWLATRQVEELLRKKLNPTRVGIMVAGFMVPHVHIHLIPLKQESDLDPGLRHKGTDEELTRVHKILTA